MSNSSGLSWGVLLILLGFGFLLRNLDLLPGSLFSLWPLLVIGTGAWMLGAAVGQRRGRGLVAGVVLLTLGGFWLLENYGKVSQEMFLPVLLMALGAGLLLRNIYRSWAL